MTYTERHRAESFGEDAALYERARPEYPATLVQDLTGGAALDVLDVGCGTGKASRAFLAGGCRVLGVEIDERMAEVARASGVEVEVGSFEGWDPAGRRFDLVVSGQAWHWVDPAVAPARAADVLREGGRLAPFWNHRDPAPDPDAPVVRATAEIYRHEAPSLLPKSGTVGAADYSDGIAGHARAIEACGRFGPCEVRTYHWGESLTIQHWLDRLATQSDHRLLEAGARSRLFASLRELLDAEGGTIELVHTTYCIVAARR